MLFRQFPYGDDKNEDEFKKNHASIFDKINFPSTIHVSRQAIDCIHYCLDKDDQSRPNAKAINKHAFLAGESNEPEVITGGR